MKRMARERRERECMFYVEREEKGRGESAREREGEEIVRVVVNEKEEYIKGENVFSRVEVVIVRLFFTPQPFSRAPPSLHLHTNTHTHTHTPMHIRSRPRRNDTRTRAHMRRRAQTQRVTERIKGKESQMLFGAKLVCGVRKFSSGQGR